MLSQIGRHQGALEHAQSALILLQEELFGGGAAVAGVERRAGAGDQPPRADRIAVLAIAYHNMGVEQEFLKKFEHSLQSYRKGVEVSVYILRSSTQALLKLPQKRVLCTSCVHVMHWQRRRASWWRNNQQTRPPAAHFVLRKNFPPNKSDGTYSIVLHLLFCKQRHEGGPEVSGREPRRHCNAPQLHYGRAPSNKRKR